MRKNIYQRAINAGSRTALKGLARCGRKTATPIAPRNCLKHGLDADGPFLLPMDLQRNKRLKRINYHEVRATRLSEIVPELGLLSAHSHSGPGGRRSGRERLVWVAGRHAVR